MSNSNLFNYYNLSHYEIDGRYLYDSMSKRPKLKAIHSIFIHKPLSTDTDTNHFFSLPTNREINVRSYDQKNFSVIQIGKTKKLWFPNEQSYAMVKDELKVSNGILAYWDTRSIAFIVEGEELLEIVKDFLNSVPYIGYFKDKEGILLVK